MLNHFRLLMPLADLTCLLWFSVKPIALTCVKKQMAKTKLKAGVLCSEATPRSTDDFSEIQLSLTGVLRGQSWDLGPGFTTPPIVSRAQAHLFPLLGLGLCRQEGAGVDENWFPRSLAPTECYDSASWQGFQFVLISAEIQLTRTLNSLSILVNWIFSKISPEICVLH